MKCPRGTYFGLNDDDVELIELWIPFITALAPSPITFYLTRSPVLKARRYILYDMAIVRTVFSSIIVMLSFSRLTDGH